MNERERDLIVESLQMRINYIDTGSPHLTQFEAHRQGLTLPVKTRDMTELAITLSDLAERLRRWKPKPPPAPAPAVKPKKKAEWEIALDLAREVIGMCGDLLDNPDKESGWGYAESVTGIVEGIFATIEDRQEVTPKQWRALENLKEGIERWNNQ
jgi:hypothetical protein